MRLVIPSELGIPLDLGIPSELGIPLEIGIPSEIGFPSEIGIWNLVFPSLSPLNVARVDGIPSYQLPEHIV